MTFTSRLRPLVLALAFTLPLAGCWDKSPEARIEEAKQAIQKSDYKTAVIELKSALQKAPNNAEARLLLGQSLQTTGDWLGSEKELRKAMELGGQSEQALPLLAKTLVKLGKYKDVTELVIPTAILTSASMASIQAEKANAFIALEKPVEAASAILEGDKTLAAIGGNTFSNDLQLAKARLALVNKQPAQALALLDAALQRDAKFIDALYMKAQLLLAEGKTLQALKEYELITTAKPAEVLAHLAIADIKLRSKDVASAEKSLQSAEKIDANMILTKFTRAKISLSKGDLKNANEVLQQILGVAPDHLPSLMLDSAVNYGLGNYEQSLKNAKRVLAQKPEYLYAAKLVSANEMHRGNAKAALETLQPLLQAHPDDIGLLSMLGEANLQAKQYDKAMAYLDHAAALQPKNPSIKQSQARGHLALGKSEQAITELEQAVSLAEKAGQADIMLIMQHLNRKNYDKALEAITALEKKLPSNPVTSNLRGLALTGKNDRVGARKAFEQAVATRPDFFTAAANLARMDIAEGKPISARQRFESILKADAKNTQAMMALADLAFANKAEKDALGWLEKAAKNDSKAFRPRAGLVQYYLSKKTPQQALAIARETVSANPDSPEALSLLGTAQMAAGDKPSALSSFTKATEKAPNSADALYQLGAAQVASERISEGRASFEKSLVLQPDHVSALDGLLLLDVADRKLDRALQRARAFQAHNPKSPEGYVREGDILFGQKLFAQAAKVYEKGLTMGNDLKTFAKMQDVLVRSGNQKLAGQKLADLLSHYPKDIQVQALAAEYYLSVGQNAESLRLYEGLRQTQPNSPAILNNMAVLYQRLKDGRSLLVAEQALKLAPDNPGIMDTLGWILVEQGQITRAVDILKKASAKAPNLTTVRYHLAIALAKAGNKTEAKRELGLLLKMGGRFTEAEDARKLLSTL